MSNLSFDLESKTLTAFINVKPNPDVRQMLKDIESSLVEWEKKGFQVQTHIESFDDYSYTGYDTTSISLVGKKNVKESVISQWVQEMRTIFKEKQNQSITSYRELTSSDSYDKKIQAQKEVIDKRQSELNHVQSKVQSSDSKKERAIASSTNGLYNAQNTLNELIKNAEIAKNTPLSDEAILKGTSYENFDYWLLNYNKEFDSLV